MLLDTHYFIWWREGDATRFSPTAMSAAQQATFLAASCATFYEIAQLIRRGRLPYDTAWPNINAMAFIEAGGRILEADHRIMTTAGALDWDHGDPFDRLIVATAQEHEIDLLTRDERITAYYERSIG